MDSADGSQLELVLTWRISAHEPSSASKKAQQHAAAGAEEAAGGNSAAAGQAGVQSLNQEQQMLADILAGRKAGLRVRQMLCST